MKMKEKICIECKESKFPYSSKMCKVCWGKTKKKKKKPKFPLETNIEVEVPSKYSSQFEMFIEIWNERPRVSEISGKALVGPDHREFVGQFEHILTKGAYPRYKFNKDNIMLMTFTEHFDLTNNTAQCKANKIFDNYFILKDELKEKYYAEKENQ